jgi:predicted CopG family antitoxin
MIRLLLQQLSDFTLITGQYLRENPVTAVLYFYQIVPRQSQGISISSVMTFLTILREELLLLEVRRVYSVSKFSKGLSIYSMYVLCMKTIMIRDDVYRRLVEIKGDKSFSEIIEELIEESLTVRRRKLEKYFGILSDREAEVVMDEIKEARKIL